MFRRMCNKFISTLLRNSLNSLTLWNCFFQIFHCCRLLDASGIIVDLTVRNHALHTEIFVLYIIHFLFTYRVVHFGSCLQAKIPIRVDNDRLVLKLRFCVLPLAPRMATLT